MSRTGEALRRRPGVAAQTFYDMHELTGKATAASFAERRETMFAFGGRGSGLEESGSVVRPNSFQKYSILVIGLSRKRVQSYGFQLFSKSSS